MRQLTFLEEPNPNDEILTIADAVRYNAIHVSLSTFIAGLSSSIHSWFRLTPSFGPDLVREMLGALDAQPHDYILDPFSGAGTTAIECSLEGFDSLGFEINPLLHFVNRVSLDWDLDTKLLHRHHNDIIEHFDRHSSAISFDQLSALGLTIPPIHNPTRWWRPDVLKDILIIKQAIHSIADLRYRDFFRLALAGVLVPDLTNVTLGRLQLHFIDRTNETIDVRSSYSSHVTRMIDDLDNTHKLKQLGKAQVLFQDATDLSFLTIDRKINCVITSPPYPNRYSYVWNTRPHLYMLDIIRHASDASAIDRRTIGGTWGTATSELMKGVIPPLNAAVQAVVGPVVDDIRRHDNLMANYAMHYFNRLTKHILELERIASPSLRIAYVVGNSWLRGVYIETDVLLGNILESLKVGYKVADIHRFRRRHSGKDLYESIVYAKKVF